MTRRPSRAIKVLVVGNEPSDFVTPIAQHLNASGDFEIDLLELRAAKPKRSDAELSAAFAHRVERPQLGLRSLRVADALRAALHPKSRDVVATMLGGSYSAAWPLAARIKESARYLQNQQAVARLYAGYDIVNFHLLSGVSLYMARHAAAAPAVVASFWGSDLLTTPPGPTLDEQVRLIARSDRITVQTPEMKEIFLSKFGRSYGGAVRLARFASDVRIVAEIDRVGRSELRAAFRRKLGAGPDDIVLTIGHCAHPIDRHLEAMAALSRACESLRARLVVVLPLTYLREKNDDYLKSVRACAHEASFRTVCLESFLSDHDVAELRCGSDITLRVSETDALSASLIEALYAGSIGVLGAWLPYSALRAAGVEYLTVGSAEEIASVVARAVNALSAHKARADENAVRLRPFVSVEEVAAPWASIYRELAQPMVPR